MTPPPPLPTMPSLLMPNQDANSPSPELAAVTEELPCPTVEPVVAEEPPCPTEEAIGSEETEEPEMEEEENAPNLTSQISLSFIEGRPRPSTSQHPAAMHGSNPPQDQGASVSDMFEEMNVVHEPLFVINKKTLKGAVGPKIGMNVARISAALAKKPVFFLDWNSNADESAEQEIAAGSGGLLVPDQPAHQMKKERENM